MDHLDLYIAGMGRSGTTMVANMLSVLPIRQVLVEPSASAFGHSRPFDLASDLEARAAYLKACKSMIVDEEKLERIAIKEVIPRSHLGIVEVFAPTTVLIVVRDIHDVALSALEKIKRQGNHMASPTDWVAEACYEGSKSLVQLSRSLEGTNTIILRYEDFAGDQSCKPRLERQLDWPMLGDPFANFDSYDRSYEVERNRHFRSEGRKRLSAEDRGLPETVNSIAESIAETCGAYQERFGYTNA